MGLELLKMLFSAIGDQTHASNVDEYGKHQIGGGGDDGKGGDDDGKGGDDDGKGGDETRTAPVILMPDGSQVAIDDHKIKLGETEMTVAEANKWMGDAQKEYKELVDYRGKLDSWNASLDQREQSMNGNNGNNGDGDQSRNNGNGDQSGDQTQLGLINIEDMDLTENEKVFARNHNAMVSHLNQSNETMDKVLDYLNKNHKVTADRNLEDDLRRASDHWKVGTDELLEESRKMGIADLNVVGEVLSLRSEKSESAKKAAEEKAKADAAEAARQSSTGTGGKDTSTTDDNRSKPRRGLAADAWKNDREGITKNYDLLSRRGTPDVLSGELPTV